MELNQVFYYQKIQLVTVDYEGIIVNTENTLFHLETSRNIKEFHPIFETILTQICNEDTQELAIPGLQIEGENENKYCDIRLKRENGYITILFFNFTSRYKEEHLQATVIKKPTLTKHDEINNSHIS